MKIFYPFHFTCLTFCLQFIVVPSFTQGVWTLKVPLAGNGMYGAVGFFIGTKGYIGAGGNNAEFWEWDQLTNTWTQKANYTGIEQYAAGFSIGNKGYIGTGTYSQAGEFWEWDQATNIWTQKNNYRGITDSIDTLVANNVWGAVGFSIGNKGYIGTGDNYGYSNEFWEYDPSTDTWIQKTNFGGTGRVLAVGFSIGAKGYIGTGRGNAAYKDFWEWDQATDTWTQKADFGGVERLTAVGFSIGNKGYIGTGRDVSGNVFMKDFWEWDQETNTWIEVTSFKGGKRMNAFCFSNGDVGYIGGGLDSNNSYASDFWEFNPITVSVSSNTFCNNQCNGSATATVSLGNPPYSYVWSTTPQQTSQTAIGLCPGLYSITVSDSYASVTAEVMVSALPPPDPVSICLVTVDSNSQNNIIIWDKTPYANLIDSFFIYREIATNSYQLLGAVPFDSLSLFIDTVRAQYFPNSGNPNAGTYRYKIIVRDTCGIYSALSAYHNTIFITNNNGNFFWSQPYTVENSSNPVSAYILMRDDFRTGNWHAVNSVSGTQQGITDPDYASWQVTARWRVETQWNISCTPTLKSPAAYNSSFSNIYQNIPLGLNEDQMLPIISIIPNPSSGIFTIYLSEKISGIEVFNVLGEKIYSSQINSNKSELDLRNQPQGIYFVEIIYGGLRKTEKLILE